MTRLTAALMTDPDEQVRAMAAAHHAAIEQVRRLLGGAGPEVVGSVLVALAREADVAVGTEGVAEHLRAWWQEHERALWS